MEDLALADLRHLQAADGWLGLGAPAEARAELDAISPSQQEHPVVLTLRWRVHAALRQWEEALVVATTLIQLQPDAPGSWVNRSFALHELRRTAEARDHLMSVVSRFPDHAVLRYNLACYECQLGNLPKAQEWLDQAFALGGGAELRKSALEDPDLSPLWKRY